MSLRQLVGDGVGEGVADVEVGVAVVEFGAVDGVVRDGQSYAGAVIERMRPGVGGEDLEVMPELLFELELEGVVVGVVVIGDDVEVLEVGVAAHGGREHLVAEQVTADVADVGDL